MSDCARPSVRFVRSTLEIASPAPVTPRDPPWRSLVGSFTSATISVTIAAVLIATLPRLLSWGMLRAVWSGGGSACTSAGACWAFLRAKYAFILFGIYPPAERWRPALAIAIVLLLTLWSLPVSHWTRRTLAGWGVGLMGSLWLMSGGGFGLTKVPTSAWGGLPITLLLTVLSLGLGFPLAVALALGRQSKLPVVRLVCVGFIEIVRSLPLLSILFVASIMLPLMLPQQMSVDKFSRALAALTLFCAAYLAEVVRGGIQGVVAGQGEAARALGLSWLQTTRFVVLPQALRKVIPSLTNTVVVIVKNTSLVLVVGLFDLLSTGRAAAADPDWPAPYTETYLFIALIYFVICFGISRYTLSLERTLAAGRNS